MPAPRSPSAPRRSTSRTPAEHNHLLRRLPRAEYARLLPDLEPVTLPVQHVVYEPNAPIAHVYFPQGGMLSLILPFADGGTVEVGMIGREGVGGVPAVLGVETMSTRCIVQLEVRAHRMRLRALRRHAGEARTLRTLLKRYTQVLFDQIAQSAACNRRHTLERRCARWLLMSQDRAESDVFPLTQEFLAYMLGVHRPAVATALGTLRRAGLIGSLRGGIRITDRAGLEGAACECYAAIRERERTILA